MLMIRMRSIRMLSLCACLIVSGCATPSFMIRGPRPLPRNAVPQVIAVTTFENRSGFAGQWELGGGMADLLVSELVKSGNFVVVERAQLQRVVSELDMQKSDRFRKEGRVGDGRLINAKYQIRGVINDFSQVGGGSIVLGIRQIIFGGRGHRARVALTLTIIDVESGEILDAVQAAGIARARESFAEGSYKQIAFGGDAFFRTPLGSATSAAIRRGVADIVEKIPVVMWEPMIAEVLPDQRIVVNGGRRHGIVPGSIYYVRGQGRTVTDPATGNAISVIPGAVVGSIEIVAVEDAISYAEPARGAVSALQRGQRLVLAQQGSGRR